MPQENGKGTFYNNARKQGSSLVVTIPKKIVEERNIKPGDEIAFELEHSKKIQEREDRENGDYFSAWNETLQSGKREQQK
jgi:antitoxin component of MazEF toxin-antitoxin module